MFREDTKQGKQYNWQIGYYRKSETSQKATIGSMTRRRLVCNQRRMLLTVMDYLNKK
jgi:hypothetical protein